MEGRLYLSTKEQYKIVVLSRLAEQEMTLAEAARRMEVSYRQAQRLQIRFTEHGNAGLVHRSRDKPSGRQRCPEEKQAILTICSEHYSDFGPTHASQMLRTRQGMLVEPETLRLWLIASGKHIVRSRRSKHRSWRERKARFGEMVQMDGSVHDWFEGRGPRCFLIVMIDDATGRVLMRFAKEETTLAVMDTLEAWVTRYGIPETLYVDRKNVYVTSRAPTLEEQLDKITPVTQFGNACRKLGVQIIAAQSPQAKGRVERCNGTLQKRLIKEMRLDNICSIEEGNEYLKSWTEEFNRQFEKPARSQVDAHRILDEAIDLQSVFCHEEVRTLAKDWTIQFESRLFSVSANQDNGTTLPKSGSRLTVQRLRDGTVRLFMKGQQLRSTEVNIKHRAMQRQAEKEAAAALPKAPAKPYSPAQDHPWRGDAGHKPEHYIKRRSQNDILTELADRMLGIPEKMLGMEDHP